MQLVDLNHNDDFTTMSSKSNTNFKRMSHNFDRSINNTEHKVMKKLQEEVERVDGEIADINKNVETINDNIDTISGNLETAVNDINNTMQEEFNKRPANRSFWFTNDQDANPSDLFPTMGWVACGNITTSDNTIIYVYFRSS